MTTGRINQVALKVVAPEAPPPLTSPPVRGRAHLATPAARDDPRRGKNVGTEKKDRLRTSPSMRRAPRWARRHGMGHEHGGTRTPATQGEGDGELPHASQLRCNRCPRSRSATRRRVQASQRSQEQGTLVLGRAPRGEPPMPGLHGSSSRAPRLVSKRRSRRGHLRTLPLIAWWHRRWLSTGSPRASGGQTHGVPRVYQSGK